MSTVSFFLLLLITIVNSDGLDVFCGELEVHDSQRFSQDSQVLRLQQTADLKQCLELCCGVPNCDGVSFTGFIFEQQSNKPNCLFITCRRQCQLKPKGDYNDGDGVVSVILRRHAASNETLKIPDIVTDANLSSQPTGLPVSPWNEPSTTPTATHVVQAGYSPPPLTPVWVVGLAIVIAVVCLGLNLSLISAYICYKRKQSKKRKAQITSLKGPTLHAFNPAI